MKKLIYISALLVFYGVCPNLSVAQEISQIVAVPNVTIHDWNQPFGNQIITLDRPALKCYEEPIYLVDGNYWSKEKLSELNPENITSVKVLKNKDEWKKYGLSLNSSGVVVITTKKER